MPVDFHGLLLTALQGVGTLLATVLVGVAVQLLKKHGIEATQQEHDFMLKVATAGINYAEELCANRTITAGDKHGAAIDYVVKQAPSLTRAEASDFIHAALPDSGHGAATPAAEPYDPTKSQPKP